jgi:hypothetical protein
VAAGKRLVLDRRLPADPRIKQRHRRDRRAAQPSNFAKPPPARRFASAPLRQRAASPARRFAGTPFRQLSLPSPEFRGQEGRRRRFSKITFLSTISLRKSEAVLWLSSSLIEARLWRRGQRPL